MDDVVFYFFLVAGIVFTLFGICTELLVFADSQLHATLTERCMIVS